MNKYWALRPWQVFLISLAPLAAIIIAIIWVDYTYGDDVTNPWNGVLASNSVPFTAMQQIPANSLGGNPTGLTGDVVNVAMPSCSTSSSALTWVSNTGVACNSTINASTLGGASFSAPGAIGSGTPGAGTFTTLTVNGSSILPSLSGTTGSIGGGLLTAGTCASGTVNITNATTSMPVVASPNTYPGDGIVWDSQVTSAGVVTVKVCAIVALTPSASTFNVRVIQ